MIVLMTQSFGEIKACLCVRMDAHLLPTYPEVVVILLLRLNIMCFKKNGMPLYLDFPLFDGKRVCPHTHNLVSRFWAINVLFKPAFDFSRGLLFAVLSFSQRRWKNEKVFPASYSRLVLPTALYRSPLSCQRRIPAAVVSGPAPPRHRMRVSFGIFNANFGLISVCVNAEGFCGWLLFSFSESMFMNAQNQAAGLAWCSESVHSYFD